MGRHAVCRMSLIELFLYSVCNLYFFFQCAWQKPPNKQHWLQKLPNRNKIRAGPSSYDGKRGGGEVELEKDSRTYQTCKYSHCFHPLTKCCNLKHRNFNFNYKLFHVLTCCIIILFPYKESTPCQRLSDKLSAEYFLCCTFWLTLFSGVGFLFASCYFLIF